MIPIVHLDSWGREREREGEGRGREGERAHDVGDNVEKGKL